jgi:hypothetical protein
MLESLYKKSLRTNKYNQDQIFHLRLVIQVYMKYNKNTKFLLSGFAKIKVDECEPIISDDFKIGPDGAYEHSDRNISFQSILWKVSEQLQNVQYDNGDRSDLGNEIGISVGKGVENMTENEISIFISGIRHGISLTNGTH